MQTALKRLDEPPWYACHRIPCQRPQWSNDLMISRRVYLSTCHPSDASHRPAQNAILGEVALRHVGFQ